MSRRSPWSVLKTLAAGMAVALGIDPGAARRKAFESFDGGRSSHGRPFCRSWFSRRYTHGSAFRPAPGCEYREIARRRRQIERGIIEVSRPLEPKT